MIFDITYIKTCGYILRRKAKFWEYTFCNCVLCHFVYLTDSDVHLLQIQMYYFRYKRTVRKVNHIRYTFFNH